MNQHAKLRIGHSACPHDCPSTCALEVELLDANRIGRVHGAEAKYGSETVWPYFYAGTMGLVQRDGIHRLRHAKKYSGFFGSICTNLAWTGYTMGTGRLLGSDPREM